MERLIDYWDKLMGHGGYALWVEVGIIVFVMALVAYMAQRVLKRLYTNTKSTTNSWDDALFESLQGPVRLIVWTIGLGFAAQVAFADMVDTRYVELLPKLQDALYVVAGTWFAWKFSHHLEANLLLHSQAGDITLDATTINAISKIFRLAIVITAVLAGMKTLGFSIGGLLAAGGVGGLVIGMASKDLLANFFGALMLYLDKPFKVGDWVRSPDREIEGTVEEIGWRLTRIRTFDKRPLYVPNSAFTTISIENPSRMQNRRIREVVGIRYDDMQQVQAVASGIEDMLRAHEAIDTNQTLFVHLVAFNASSVDILIYTFTKTTEWVPFQAIKQDVLLKVAQIVEAHHAEMAYPTQTVHVASMPTDEV